MGGSGDSKLGKKTTRTKAVAGGGRKKMGRGTRQALLAKVKTGGRKTAAKKPAKVAAKKTASKRK